MFANVYADAKKWDESASIAIEFQLTDVQLRVLSEALEGGRPQHGAGGRRHRDLPLLADHEGPDELAETERQNQDRREPDAQVTRGVRVAGKRERGRGDAFGEPDLRRGAVEPAPDIKLAFANRSRHRLNIIRERPIARQAFYM